MSNGINRANGLGKIYERQVIREKEQRLNKKIEQLQAEIRGLKEEVLELMLAIFEGSKGERKRINAELLEQRRKDFDIKKGGI